MPEHLKIKYEVKKVQENIDFYMKKDKDDKFAVFKGVIATNK